MLYLTISIVSSETAKTRIKRNIGKTSIFDTPWFIADAWSGSTHRRCRFPSHRFHNPPILQDLVNASIPGSLLRDVDYLTRDISIVSVCILWKIIWNNENQLLRPVGSLQIVSARSRQPIMSTCPNWSITTLQGMPSVVAYISENVRELHMEVSVLKAQMTP